MRFPSRGRGIFSRSQAVGGLLAAVLLATVAATGHAAAERGLDRIAHLCADALHLVAAGAWLGALVPLIALLQRSSGNASAETLAFAVRATRRFSTLGIASMAALLLSGIVNAFYTVRDATALLESQYGRLLLVKVSLFVLIVCFAATNRMLWMRRLAAGSAAVLDRARALRKLRRNAIFEAALGYGIIALIGKLGITIPVLHMH